ncbi:MAG: YdhR family protein [Burkholderiales bacterium]|nr:YdhR family protein [Burkholderiales bacterium]
MTPCIVVCHFQLPVPTEEKFIEIAKRSAPMFAKLGERGLISKDYVRGADGAGGVYVWESRAAAEAWFTEEKLAEYTQIFGARPTLTWYDAHLTVDNKAGQVRINGEPAAES